MKKAVHAWTAFLCRFRKIRVTGLVFEDLEIDLTLFEFLHRNSRRFVLAGIDIDAGQGSTLQLFAALGREQDKSIL